MLETLVDDSPPAYNHLFGSESSPSDQHVPCPDYSPSIYHLSLIFFSRENKYDRPIFRPALFEINSTQINVHELDSGYEKFAKYYFSKLLPDYIDPAINIKSYSPSVRSVKPIGEKKKEKKRVKLTNFLQKLSFDQLPELYKDHLSYYELHSDACSLVHEMLLNKPNLYQITNPKHEENLSQTFKKIKGQKLLFTASLQELMRFGSATDYHNKPFTLRLLFPQLDDQFLITSYTSRSFVEIYYKLNIARELSFDIDDRLLYPVDNSAPRRCRGNMRRRRESVGLGGRTSRGRSSTIGSSVSGDTGDTLEEEEEIVDDFDFDSNDFDAEIEYPTTHLSKLPTAVEHNTQDQVLDSGCQSQLDPIELIISTDSDANSNESSLFTSTLSTSHSSGTTEDDSYAPPQVLNLKSQSTKKKDFSFKREADRGALAYKELVYTLRCIRPFKLKHAQSIREGASNV